MASNTHTDDAFEPEITGDTEVSGDKRNILLLGDDGRMAKLLRQMLGDCQGYQLHAETEILEGISLSSSCDYQLVLLNAKRLGYKTTEAVAALHRINPTTKLVLYGPAYAEIYAHSALKKGADDYLTWPIPAAEIKRYLSNNKSVATANTDRFEKTVLHPSRSVGSSDTSGQRRHSDTSTMLFSQEQWMVHYHQLAQLVPHGYAGLVEQTEKLLSELLAVKWVKIKSVDKDDDSGFQPIDSNYPHIPLNGPTGAIGHMQIGPATDVVDVTSGQLETAAHQISGFIGTILHLARRDEQLKQLAIVDELTGAYNRRYLEYFMRQVMTQSANEHTEVTLLLFDIDEFKHYNDTYGHAAGDEILRQATNLTKRCCREHDIVARIGGDEFGVLFWDTGRQREVFSHDGSEDPGIAEPQADAHTKNHAAMVMFMSNRFRRMMTTNAFPGLGPEARGVLTVSGGLARFPRNGKSVEELLAQADKALLKAKRSGKNRIYLVGRPR